MNKKRFFIGTGAVAVVAAVVFNVSISLRGESHSDITLDKIQVLAKNEGSNWCNICGQYYILCTCKCAVCGWEFSLCQCEGATLDCDQSCHGTQGRCFRWDNKEYKCKAGYGNNDNCPC